MQKLPVDVGAVCPVRDGTFSLGGCAFCNGRSFVPKPCEMSDSVSGQLEASKEFFNRKKSKGQSTGFLAYFQAGSNTYGHLAERMSQFEEALQVEGVQGVVIGTRPDCLPSEWLLALKRLATSTFVMVELGVESVNNAVLQQIGRGHSVEDSQRAILDLADCGVSIGVHFIEGLPGETRESMLEQARWLSDLPVDVVKLHQLQILKGARMELDYLRNPQFYQLWTMEDYVVFVADYLELLSSRIAVERFVSQAPPGMLVAPRWGVKNDEVVRCLIAEMQKRGSQQGKKCRAE